MRAVLAFFTVGWAVYPIAFYMPDTQKSTVLHRGFLQQGIYSIALQNYLSLNAAVAEE
jgi:hypothetical protein